VSFRYPGTDRLALEHFDLEIPAGRTVAIVGANGAGKSTLIKLLARFYDPEAGRVEIDGVDLRRTSPAELHRLMTIMFQTPMMYQGSARENIAMSDLGTEPGSPRVEEAARDAGAHEFITTLAGKYDTLLGKSFPGGTELSGGEWQRVAMARAYFRRTPVVVLDEPTSQMDSWAEAEWFERFRHLTGNATALIITHRLSIARRADVIHVMEHGRIVESGAHEELLARGGRYAQSWESQGRPALAAVDQQAINAGA
jgi:ATP-binding cassette, subfamily B, bacterial